MENTKGQKKMAVLAGGSGFLGQKISERLTRLGWEIIILTRDPVSYEGPGKPVKWDGRTMEGDWISCLEGASALINLTGKSVNCRPSEQNREQIYGSRIDSVRVLGEALRKTFRPPSVWVQASSLAIYGDAGDRICDESAFVPGDYPSDVCVRWESELGTAVRPGMRWAILRLGFVLGRDRGALPMLNRLAKFGLGGKMGNGRQWISWIHEEDAVDLFVEAIRNPKVSGIYNATGMQPVTNEEFMSELRRVLGAPIALSAPAWMIRTFGPLVNSDPQIALEGRRCLPFRIHRQGFHFRFHNLEDALIDLIAESKRTKDRQYGTVTATAR